MGLTYNGLQTESKSLPSDKHMARINKDNINHLMDYSIYVPTRTIYMGSEQVFDSSEESGTDAQMAERIIKNLHILESQSAEPITILLNNLGGDAYHGMAIFDAIKECRSHTTIRVYGQAMSMGSLILQAANERIITPNAVLMIHYGTWGTHDHPKITYNFAEEGKRFDAKMERIFMDKILQRNPKFKLRDLKKMLNFDTFLTANLAVQLGLADSVG